MTAYSTASAIISNATRLSIALTATVLPSRMWRRIQGFVCPLAAQPDQCAILIDKVTVDDDDLGIKLPHQVEKSEMINDVVK
jgi:hypothetical protein